MTFGRPAIIRPQLLALFTEPGQWFRTEQFVKLTGQKRNAVRKALFRMRLEGHIHMVGGGHFTRYYLTAQEAENGKADYAMERAEFADAHRQQRNEKYREQWKADHMRKSPAIERCIVLLVDGMTYASIAEVTGVSPHTARHAMTQLVNAGRAWKVERGNQAAAYYRTEEAAQQALCARLLKQAVTRPKMTPARKAFNDANGAPKACLPPQFLKPNHCAFNPDARRMSHREAWDAAEPVIPNGVQKQVIPGAERWGGCPHRAKWAAAA